MEFLKEYNVIKAYRKFRKKYDCFKHIIINIWLFIAFNHTYAATTPNIPNSVQPGLLPKNINLPTTNPVPKSQPTVSVPAAPQTDIANANLLKLRLTKIIIHGATVYKQADLAPLYEKYYHKEISVADLQKIAADITNKYRNDGYILSRAILPPQHIKDGVVRIQIIEGFISSYQIEGEVGKSKSLLETYAKQIMGFRPVNIKNLERYILLANDIPGLEVKSILSPSESVSGAAKLTLLTHEKPISGTINYDNYGTRYLGPQEVLASVSVNSLLTPGSQDTFKVLSTTNTKQMNYFEYGHSEIVGNNGTRLAVGATKIRSQPGFLLAPFEVKGRDESFQIAVSHPLVRSRSDNLVLNSNFNYKNSNLDILSTPFYLDRIRSVEAGFRYDFIDKYQSYNVIDTTIEHGFLIMGANNGGDRSRPNGRSNFTKINVQLSRQQLLTNRFSAYASINTQYAFNPLLASEQLGFGGVVYGRGYDSSEIVGDKGVEGSLELRMDTQPAPINNLQYYVFYDIGKVWNIDTSQTPSASAASTGVGTRITLTKFLSGNLFIAKPLTRPVASAVAAGKDGKMSRGYFQITLSF